MMEYGSAPPRIGKTSGGIVHNVRKRAAKAKGGDLKVKPRMRKPNA